MSSNKLSFIRETLFGTFSQRKAVFIAIITTVMTINPSTGPYWAATLHPSVQQNPQKSPGLGVGQRAAATDSIIAHVLTTLAD